MPKYRKRPDTPSSSDRVRFSPYINSKNRENCKKNKMESCDDQKGQCWEEARCPICMEHPHNAVLLICSSHEKGCQPYMCKTSSRHSNCLDRFCKMYAVTPSRSTDDNGDQPNMFVSCGGKHGPDDQFVCPLCRGQISGWIVEESARRCMNSMVRSCALETCDFSGNYGQLRKHARVEHPSARPSEADKERLSDWNDLETEAEEEEEEEADEYDSGDCQDFDDTGEGKLEPLYPGDDFFNHIHFGDENDKVLEEHYSIENGVFKYYRTTITGKSYEFAMVLE